jgi:hypothetical protein
MDPIDRNPAENPLRVIDYKFKLGAQPLTADKNLYRSALRGQKLQPPFYSLLGRRAAGDAARSAQPQVDAKFYYIAPRWRDGPLVTESFGADGLSGQLGAEIRNTMTRGRHSRRFHSARRLLRSLRRRGNLPQESSAEPVARRERSRDGAAPRAAR